MSEIFPETPASDAAEYRHAVTGEPDPPEHPIPVDVRSTPPQLAAAHFGTITHPVTDGQPTLLIAADPARHMVRLQNTGAAACVIGPSEQLSLGNAWRLAAGAVVELPVWCDVWAVCDGAAGPASTVVQAVATYR